MKNNSFDQCLFLITTLTVGALLLGSNSAVAQTVDASVTNAESQINSFFASRPGWAPNSTPVNPNAQAFVNQINSTLTSPADQQTVFNYYENSAIKIAEASINAFFAYLAGNYSEGYDTAGAQSFESYIEAPILAQADQQTVFNYYEQKAVSTAEYTFNILLNQAYAGALNPSTTASCDMSANIIEAPILVQQDQQTAYNFYEQKAITTSEGMISKYFASIAAGTTSPTSQSAAAFEAMVVAPVMAQADQQTVYNNYEQTAITTAEGFIAKYFASIVAGTMSPTPQSAQAFEAMVMAPVLAQADQQTVYNNYEQTAITTAEGFIAKYFASIVAGTTSPTPQSAQAFEAMVMAPVLAQADQQTVYNNYEQTAITTAEGFIAKYFASIAAGTTSPTSQSAAAFEAMVMAPVLAQADQQTVYNNYEQTAITTAEGFIAKYFASIAAGTTSPTPQSAQAFEAMVMAPVLAQADQQTVYNNYEQTAITTAEGFIAKYFASIAAGTTSPTPQSVQAFEAMVIAPVLAQADQQTVINYFNQKQVVYQYQIALKLIAQYQSQPNSTNLSSALQAVLVLKPNNNILAASGLGVYDDTLNQLMQAVSVVLLTTNNQTSLTPQAKKATTFGSSVAIDNSGNVYISTATATSDGDGVIYEYSKNSKGQWKLVNDISPINHPDGDHFGRLITINGNTLAASSEPANGDARVYMFNYSAYAQQTWSQETYLDLPSIANVSKISSILLASAYNSIIVGLPTQGEVIIFVHVYDYNTGFNNNLVSDSWQPVYTAKVPGIVSVAGDGLFAAIGTNTAATSTVAASGAVKVLKASFTSSFNRNSQTEYSMSWAADTSFSGANGFGQALGLYENPPVSLPLGNSSFSMIQVPTINSVTLAIGSPLENTLSGAVYVATKAVNPTTKSFVWSTANPVSLIMPSASINAGSHVSLKGDDLVVSAQAQTGSTFGPLAMVYQLNSNNQWVWAYTLTNVNPLFASSLATDGKNVVVGSPKAANDTDSADISQVEIVTPN